MSLKRHTPELKYIFVQNATYPLPTLSAADASTILSLTPQAMPIGAAVDNRVGAKIKFIKVKFHFDFHINWLAGSETQIRFRIFAFTSPMFETGAGLNTMMGSYNTTGVPLTLDHYDRKTINIRWEKHVTYYNPLIAGRSIGSAKPGPTAPIRVTIKHPRLVGFSPLATNAIEDPSDYLWLAVIPERVAEGAANTPSYSYTLWSKTSFVDV